MSNEPTTPPPSKTWVYGGRRWSNSKIRYALIPLSELTADEEMNHGERLFKKKPAGAYIVGRCVDIPTEYGEDGGVTLWLGSGEPAAGEVSAATVGSLQARDASAAKRQAAHRAARKTLTPALDDAVTLIAEQVADIRGFYDRYAFLSMVHDRIENEADKLRRGKNR